MKTRTPGTLLKVFKVFASVGLTSVTLCGLMGSARADVWTWTGAATPDARWGTAANWLDTNSLTGVPAVGDSLIFAGNTGAINTNNLAAGLGLGSITYNTFSFLNVPTGANNLILTNGITDNDGFNTNNIPILLGANQGFTNNAAGAPLVLGGTLDLNGFDLTIGGGGNVYLNGVVSGNGGVIVNGSGTLRLGAANTFTRGVTVNSGTVQMGNTGGIPNGTAAGDFTNNGTLDLNGVGATVNGLYGNGFVDNLNGTGTYILTVGNNPTNSAGTFSGTIENSSGTVGLTKVNTNTLTLTGFSSYTGPTRINAGTLALGASAALGSGPLTISPGGVLDVSAFGSGGYTPPQQDITAGRPSGFNGDIVGTLNLFNSGRLFIYNSGEAGTLTITNGNLNLSSETIFYDLNSATTPGGGTNDLLYVTGNINLSGLTTLALNPMTGTYGNGTYTLMLAGGTLSGSAANVQASALPRGISATFGTTANSLTVTVSGSATPANLVWSGANGATWGVQDNTQNWLNNGTPDNFYTFDNVIFDDTAANPNVTVSQAVTPGSMTFRNTALTYNFNGAGIGGSGGLTQNGLGAIVFDNPNNFTGDIVMNYGNLVLSTNFQSPATSTVIYVGVPPGRIVLGNAGIFQNDDANDTIRNSFKLVLNPGGSSFAERNRQSSSSMIDTIGGITRNVGGTIDFNNIGQKSASPQVGLFMTNVPTVNGIIGGWATWAGNDWVVPGNTGIGSTAYAAYQNQANPALWGAASNVVLTANPSASVNTESINSLKLTGPAAVTIGAGQTLTLSSGGLLVPGNAAGASSISGGTLLGAPNADLIVIHNSAANPLTISSTIADNGGPSSLTKAGVGTLILTGTNTYSGTTYVNGPTLTGGGGTSFAVTAAGTLQVGNGGTVGNLGNSTNVVLNGNLFYNRSDTVTFSLPVSGIGNFGNIGSGTLIVAANETYSGVTTNKTGVLQIGNGGTSGSVTNSALILNGGMLVFNRSDNVSYPGAIAGSGLLVKQGAGTLRLNGTNTYTGPTFINGGTLALGANGSISATPAMVIASGASLDASAAGGLALNSAGSGQILEGNGTVIGAVTLNPNTMISPATNGVIGTLTVNGDLTFNGGTYAVDVSTGGDDALNVSGNLNLNSGNIRVNVLGGPLPNGTYKLLTFSGSASGSPANLNLIGFFQSGQAGALAVNGNELDLVVSSRAVRNLSWVGDNVNNYWDYTTTNWLNGAALTVFSNFDNVTFNDTGSMTPPVNITAPISAGVVTVNAVGNYTFSGSGKLTDGTSLVKTNSGTLTLLNANDYAGPTFINGGTLQVGDGVTTGSSLSIGPVFVTNGAALVFDQPDNNVESGDLGGGGTLVQQGAGVLTLTGDGSLFTGPTVINSGLLQIGNGGGSGSLGSGPVTNNTAIVFDRAGTVTQNGPITGTGSLTNLTGTLVLTAKSSYTGNTVISGGTVQLGAANALPTGGAGWGNVILDGGASAAGTLDLHGFDQTINGLSGASGTVLGMVVNNSPAATNTLTINTANNQANTTFAGTLADGTGKLRLAVVGDGLSANEMLTLSPGAANTYSGGTLVSNATLLGTGSTVAPVFGLGAITLETNGSLQVPGWTGSTSPTYPTVVNPIVVANNATAFIYGTCRGNFNPASVTGPTNSTLFVVSRYVRGGWGGDWTGFHGLLIVTNTSASGNLNFRIDSASGLPNARVLLANGAIGGAELQSGAPSGSIIPIGELSGGPSTSISRYADQGSGGGGTLVVWDVGGLNTSAEFDGSISDGHGIIKSGTGTWTLTSSSLTYSGITTVSNGVLALGASATLPNTTPITVVAPGILDVSASGALNLGAQTLQGNGTINGSVTVSASTLIQPGGANAIGTLTVTNLLDLNGGGTLVMELNKTNAAGGTNDQIRAASVTLGGMLTVTNLGPALTAGDTFKLFNAPVLNGQFATVNLPVSDNGYNYTWTNRLAVDGTIQVLTAVPTTVVPTVSPTITGFSLVNGNVVISGTNAQAGGTYYLLQSTNVALPLSQWTPVATNVVSTTNNFTFIGTNAVLPGNAQQFYILSNTNN